MIGRRWKVGLILASAVLLCAGQISAQTISGIIAGQVMDPQQKALSGVSIVAHNPDTGRDFSVSTDGQGYYRILEVPPGLYEVTALLGGFQTTIHKNVRVDVNRTTVEDFPLKIQTKEETITVESISPMAVMDSPTLTSASSGEGAEKQTVDLPIITRDVNNLALLAPGVESVRTFSFASTLVPFSVNGSRGRDNNFTIDSVDNNEPLLGGAASQFTNSDIFSEYEIATGQLKAEFGRNSGGTINAVTKPGSNILHGTMFGFGQGDVFNAMTQVEKQALLTSPEASYDTTLGLTLGGPIKKEKAFFFLSYQWDRLADNLTDVFPVLSNYPVVGSAGLNLLNGLATTPALQTYLATTSVNRVPGLTNAPCFFAAPVNVPTGFFYRTTNPCLMTSTGVPINEAGLANSVTGSPACSSPADCAFFNVYNVPNANTFNLRDHQLSGRFDQHINNSNDFFTRYLFDDLASPLYPLNSAGVAAFSDIGLLSDWKTFNRARTQSLLFDYRYSRVNSLNEFRMSYSRVSQGQGSFQQSSNVQNNQSSAIIADTFDSPPALGPIGGFNGLFRSAGDLLTLGPDSSPTHISSNTYQIQDNYSYTYGKHNFKFGANFAKIDSNNLNAPDDLGFYLYPTGGLVVTATGAPVNGFQEFIESPSLYTNPVAATYNNFTGSSSTAAAVSQRLVNVQTNAQGMVTGQGPDEIKIKGFDQFYFAQDDWRARSNLTFSFGLRYENYGQPINSVHDLNKNAPVVSTDNKDFAPRLGFAWAPGQHWTVRGGYNISYNPPILDIPLLIWQSGPVSPLITTDNEAIAQLQPTGAFPGKPLPIQDLQQTLPAGSMLNGFKLPTAINTGMVQGCSQYFDLYDTLAPGFGSPALPIVPGRAFNGSTPAPVDVPIVNCSDQNTVAKNLKNPYYQSWSLGVQRELGSNYLFELDYVGGKGTRLFQRVDENPYTGWNNDCLANIASVYGSAGIGGLDLSGQCRLSRVDNSHGDILEVTNGGSSIYHALQASLTKRYSRSKYYGDVTFTTAYTWSHLIDNTSEIFGPGFISIQQSDFSATTGISGLLIDPLANSPVEAITPVSEISNQTTGNERGSSSFDRRQRFVSSFLWEPFPTKNAFLRGWQLNGLFTFQSGQPFSPLNANPASTCADATGGGFTSNLRPLIGNPNAPLDRVALVNLTTDPTCQAPGVAGGPASISYIGLNGQPIDPKTAHFVQVPLGLICPTTTVANPCPIEPTPGGKLSPVTITTTSGTETFTPAGRNILIGPGLTNLDLGLFKNVKLNERFRLQFRWEVYDVLNHPNLAYFNGSPYIANAAGASAFAYSNQRTGASITGGLPENAIDAADTLCAVPPAGCTVNGHKANYYTFLSTSTMNTGNRRMQFGVRLTF